MTYKIGDIVLVANPATLYTQQFKGQRAAVTNYVEGEIFPYEVTFPGGNTLGFEEAELEPTKLNSYLDTADEIADYLTEVEDDEINHPSHYTWLPNGIEVIDITELLNFSLGNVVKYVLRASHKHDQPLTDLRKAAWYINREIERLEANK